MNINTTVEQIKNKKIKLLKEEKAIMEDTLVKIALFAGLCGIRRGNHLLYFMNVNLEENRCEAK